VVCLVISLTLLYLNAKIVNSNIETEKRDLSDKLLKANTKIMEYEYSKNRLHKTTWIINTPTGKELQPIKIELLDDPYLTFNRDNQKTYKYKKYKIDYDKLLITGWTDFTEVYNIINDSLLSYENVTYSRKK